MSAKAVLLRAAELVEKGWTQGAYARDANGQVVTTSSPNAVTFCASGAVFRADYDLNAGGARSDTFDAFAALYGKDTGISDALAQWNDQPGRTVAEVAARFRKAAE
jgi:hypothetical protein